MAAAIETITRNIWKNPNLNNGFNEWFHFLFLLSVCAYLHDWMDFWIKRAWLVLSELLLSCNGVCTSSKTVVLYIPSFNLMLFVLITGHLCRVFLQKEDREGRLIEGFNPIKLHNDSFIHVLFGMQFWLKILLILICGPRYILVSAHFRLTHLNKMW